MKLLIKKKKKVIINITSLIDVLFLLLIFFMVSSTFVEQPGMKLELPETKSAASEKIKELVLEINSEGKMFLNGESVIWDDLGKKFKDIIPTLEDTSVTLKADKDISHGAVVRAMDIAKLSGLKKIVIATKVSKN